MIERIANKLAAIFPDAVIYTENQTSGFQVPSFYISKIMVNSKPELFEIQNRKYFYQIVYFANPETPNADMDNVAELLLNNFCSLEDYATIRNREIHVDTDNETLTLSFEIWVRMHKVDNTPMQRKVDIDAKAKERNTTS